MPHASGNPTWQDYPSTATLITADKLEAIEGVLDGLRTPPVCEARLTSAYNGLAADTWYTMTGQMAILAGSDPYSMWTQPSGSATNYQCVVPSGWGGRYDVSWQVVNSGLGSAGVGVAAVLLNCPDSTFGATAVGSYSALRGHAAMSGQSAPARAAGSMLLSAGDRLAFAALVTGSGWNMLSTQNGATRTKVVVRYVGPA